MAIHTAYSVRTNSAYPATTRASARLAASARYAPRRVPGAPATCSPLPAPPVTGLVADWAAGQLADDVQVAQVPRVLLEHVEEHPFQRGRVLAAPPLARLAHVGQVVRADDGRGPAGLRVQPGKQLVQGDLVRHVPAAVALVGPRVADVAALEPPLQPAPLHVDQVV